MKILHTADWHLGQTFYEYDRTAEHQAFLLWLVAAVVEHGVDVLLMSGDVFDVSNPSAASVQQFYSFLGAATRAQPGLQIIVIAGNHDSASRLEAPNPLLGAFNITIIGSVCRLADGQIDYDKLLVPLKGADGSPVGWCLAIPFLRNGDCPLVAGTTAPYADGVAAVYQEAYARALAIRQPGQPILAMGHLHTSGAEVSEQDKSERLILGGVELVPASAFHTGLAYTALGHIHKPQKIGGREAVRYAGSPVPMSFSEVHYKHQVVLVDVVGEQATAIVPLHIPVLVPLIRVPAQPRPLADALLELALLPERVGDMDTAPYLEVRVMLTGPEPALRHQIETALTNKYARLAKIDVRYPTAAPNEPEQLSVEELNNLKPADVFEKVYQARYNSPAPDALMALFHEVTEEVSHKEAEL